MSMSTGSQGGVKAEINVTPLIDVVLVLLIIFMVITPMLTKGRPVALPEGHDPAKKPDDSKDVILSIDKDENLFLTGAEESAMSPEAVEAALKDLHDRD